MSAQEGREAGDDSSPGCAFCAAEEEQRRLHVCSSSRYTKRMIAADGERVSANKRILCNAKEMFHYEPVEEHYSGSMDA